MIHSTFKERSGASVEKGQSETHLFWFYSLDWGLRNWRASSSPCHPRETEWGPQSKHKDTSTRHLQLHSS